MALSRCGSRIHSPESLGTPENSKRKSKHYVGSNTLFVRNHIPFSLPVMTTMGESFSGEWELPPGASLLQAFRPWHTLYGVRLRPKQSSQEVRLYTAPHPPDFRVRSPIYCGLTRWPLSLFSPVSKSLQESDRELSLIEKLLPNEILLLVFARLPVSSLGAVQCVCHQWRMVANYPSLWRAACMEAFCHVSPHVNDRLLKQFHRGCWKSMFLDRPHLRFDGIYVARNTYIRTGVTEWKVRNPVHLVCYFRYYRFMPNGSLLYRTSPEALSKVAKTLMHPLSRLSKSTSGNSGIQEGRYRIDGEKVYTAIRYENSASTEVRARLRLRSTVRGAFNRLDIESIVSFDREDGTMVPMMVDASAAEMEDDLAGLERRVYSRGLAPYVFVPWEAVNSHVLNLPVSEMDVFIAG